MFASFAPAKEALKGAVEAEKWITLDVARNPLKLRIFAEFG